MRTDGFKLYWASGADVVLEPLIGWKPDNPVNPSGWLPITPAKQDTSVGGYVLTYTADPEPEYWSIVDGVITYYFQDNDAAFGAAGV